MKLSQSIWQKFSAAPGAAVDGVVGISSEHAVGGLIRAIRTFRPQRILEVGGGIGTLTYAALETCRREDLLEMSGFRLTTIESHPFCLQQLERNLAQFVGHYEIVPSAEGLATEGPPFDLLIIDGGGDEGNDLGVQNLEGLLAPNGVIIVEGFRLFQRERIQDWFGHRPYVYRRSASFRPFLYNAASGLQAENKPYHLFVFEPAGVTRLRETVEGTVNRLFTKLVERGRSFWRRGR